MRKILITGGAGFIGAHTAKKLIEEKYEIVIIDNLNDYYDPKLKKDRLKIFLGGLKFKFYKADISNYKQLEKIFVKHKFDCICHLAAQAGVRYSLTNPWLYEKTNIAGTLNLLELAKINKIKKFVFASSSSVYGGNNKLPFSETDSVDKPVSFYAATKKSGELLAYAYHSLYGIKACGLRFFTVYGPWGRPDMAYFKFIDLIRKNKPIEIYNHGKMKRDFTYIDDIVSGVVSAIENTFDFEIINLGNNRPEELGRLIFLLEKHFGKIAKKKYLPMQAGDVIATWANINKAKKLLNYNPATPLEEGVKKFIAWYKNYYKI
ncbi:NAD-dependent epimerase/dehydratase family protein [Candidatus Falkowbacteria bacterium]|nr:NAD-dependent epimerase/dehydratase family protein [Candidatus Falkowbacteria bacterium]